MRAPVEHEVITVGDLLERDRFFKETRDVRGQRANRAQDVDAKRGLADAR